MTTTQDTSVKYYVARTNGTITSARSLAEAKAYVNHLYKNCGVIAPLVVRAANAEEAKAKAARCYAGEITCRQARQ